MELDLSLGDTPKPGASMEKHGEERVLIKVSGLSMELSLGQSANSTGEEEDDEDEEEIAEKPIKAEKNEKNESFIVDSPLQLDLLPHAPVLLNNNHGFRNFSMFSSENRGKRIPALMAAEEEANDGAASSNSAGSSFQVEIRREIISRKGNNCRMSNWKKEDQLSGVPEKVSSKAGEGKLRLSKEQSTFLEQSFREHYTLNPKQKLNLAKQLNLRPRQVEVWFQNRRARTKLKQTELDFQHLKRWCEALKEENKRLEKEVKELRASSSSLCFRSPATGRIATSAAICPFCHRMSEPRMNISKTTSILF